MTPTERACWMVWPESWVSFELLISNSTLSNIYLFPNCQKTKGSVTSGKKLMIDSALSVISVSYAGGALK